MVKLKLNENYSNDFLTTICGVAFFKEWKKQNRPEYVEIDDIEFSKNIELKTLVKQGTLIKKKIKEEVKEDKKEIEEEVKEDKKEEIVEDKKEEIVEDKKEEIVEDKKEIIEDKKI